jgi:O-antigen/teichoic acid export membrane protein
MVIVWQRWLEHLKGALALISPYSAVAMLLQVVQMACSVVVLRWVPPAQMGIWQTLVVVETYCQLARLGVVNSMNRQYPYLLGQGKEDAARRQVQTAECFTLGAVAAQLLGLCLAALVLVPARADWPIAMLTLAIFAPANSYRAFLEATFRSGQQFAQLARAQCLIIALTVLSVGLVVAYGFKGFCARTLLLAVGSTVAYAYLRPLRFRLHFDYAVFKYLLWTGWPLFVSSYLTGVAGSFGRLVILHEGGTAQLGLFAPVNAVISLGLLMPSTFAVYLLPKLNFDFGASGSGRTVVAQSLKAGLVSSVLVTPFLAVGWWLLPRVVVQFAPAYSQAIPAMQLGLLITFLGGFKISTVAFSVLQAWGPMFLYIAVLLATSWLGPWLGVRLWPRSTLEGVTFGMLGAAVIQIPFTVLCLRLATNRHREKPSGL